MADAEAICEAAQRPTMRLVAVKSEAQQASATTFNARDLLVRQRSNTINALRGHMAEFGLIAPKDISHVGRLEGLLDDSASNRPDPVRAILRDLVGVIRDLSQRIDDLDREIRQRARNDDVAKRPMTIPGMGPVIATALTALAPPIESFDRGRDLAAWMGLTPTQTSTGGKTRLGRTSRMGQLISVVSSSSVPAPWSTGQLDMEHRPAPGSGACSPGNHGCWSRWRLPTGWHA
jgi:transposase